MLVKRHGRIGLSFFACWFVEHAHLCMLCFVTGPLPTTMGTATTRGPIIVTTEGPETETSPGPITSLGSAEITTGPTGPPSGMSHHIHTGTLLCSLLVCVSVVFRFSTLVTNIATISHHPDRTIFHICIIQRNNQMPLIAMINPAVKLKLTDNTVRSGAEERSFWGARLDVLIFGLRSYHVLNHVYCRR